MTALLPIVCRFNSSNVARHVPCSMRCCSGNNSYSSFQYCPFSKNIGLVAYLAKLTRTATGILTLPLVTATLTLTLTMTITIITSFDSHYFINMLRQLDFMHREDYFRLKIISANTWSLRISICACSTILSRHRYMTNWYKLLIYMFAM
jgi:hypothetical protein